MTEKEENNNWPPFDIKSWKNIPALCGKVATEIDGKNGVAVFSLKNVGSAHKVYEIDLPKLAFLIDSENETKELIVLIQAEETNEGIVVGYRNPKGGNGACFYYELEFLSESQISEI